MISQNYIKLGTWGMGEVMVRKSCIMPKTEKKNIGSSTAKLFVSNMKVNTVVWGVKNWQREGTDF